MADQCTPQGRSSGGHNHQHTREGQGIPFPSQEKRSPPMSEEELEQKHFEEVLDGFLYYGLAMREWIKRKETDYIMSQKFTSKKFDEKMRKNFDGLHQASRHNAHFLSDVVKPQCEQMGIISEMLSVSQILSQGQHIPMRQRRVLQSEAFSRNYDKMKSTFRLLVRDWAAEGKDERSQCYAPIIEEVQSLFSERSLKEKNGTRILCPGCGLGRLPWELARKGFACQGNEFSFQMLLTSNYILNSSLKPEMFTIYPYIHTSSNHVTRANQLRTVTVPDVVINDPSLCEDFSMAAGEFVEVYGGEINSWDCVTTCFFLDTAHSPFEYVRIIYDILKPGGYWVNLGPLLYHYEESPNERSVELAFDEVMELIVDTGFEVKRSEERESWYSADPSSMMKLLYTCQFFTVRKPLSVAQESGAQKKS